mmetsp:Transcript_16431/g.42085  ORF Transcript_16431/g.42085 Transcript_16431/m.42085 type:complete len:261 (+) Transcript_16431:129-911(+)
MMGWRIGIVSMSLIPREASATTAITTGASSSMIRRRTSFGAYSLLFGGGFHFIDWLLAFVVLDVFLAQCGEQRRGEVELTNGLQHVLDFETNLRRELSPTTSIELDEVLQETPIQHVAVTFAQYVVRTFEHSIGLWVKTSGMWDGCDQFVVEHGKTTIGSLIERDQRGHCTISGTKQTSVHWIALLSSSRAQTHRSRSLKAKVKVRYRQETSSTSASHGFGIKHQHLHVHVLVGQHDRELSTGEENLTRTGMYLFKIFTN